MRRKPGPDGALPRPLPLPRRLRERADRAIRVRAEQSAAQIAAPAAEQAMAPLYGRTDRVEGDIRWLFDEIARLARQVSGLESRLADIEDGLRRGPAEAAATETERTMLDLITAEHGRVRARLTAVACYEERLRRLESRD